ncbi:MAG: hypothetical protein VXZ73_03660 [Pseudomonadota bacterium]|nr:hypothetical protein [Pseudomonadota bacterium]
MGEDRKGALRDARLRSIKDVLNDAYTWRKLLRCLATEKKVSNKKKGRGKGRSAKWKHFVSPLLKGRPKDG